MVRFFYENIYKKIINDDMKTQPHIAVLKDEVIKAFEDINDGYIVDCTVGFGSHSKALLEKLPNIKMICVDQDSQALEYSKKYLSQFKDRVEFVKSNFANIKDIFDKYPIKAILADIGVSSFQLDEQSRGFGFDSEVLDMRMDTNLDFSAYDVVNTYSKQELEDIFQKYGELRAYKKVAHLICEQRAIKPIQSSEELSSIMYASMNAMKPSRGGRVGMHPATLVFQAIRIEVNRELEVLSSLLENIEQSNFTDTKVAIICFHSLEDKIVKNYFRKWKTSCICDSSDMRCTCGNNHQKGITITKKPIVPTKEEIQNNPRSRSSKMRIFNFTQKEKYKK